MLRALGATIGADVGDPLIAAIMDGHYQHTGQKDPLEGKCYADGEDWPCEEVRVAKAARGPVRFVGATKTEANPFRRE
jgi:hypothetical protein